MNSNVLPPPVILHSETNECTRSTVKCLERLYKRDDIYMRNSKVGAYFYPQTKESYELFIKYIQFHDQEYFTFMPPWNKAKQIVLKGIFATDQEADIIGDLSAKGISCLKIDAIGERWHSKDSPIYLLELAEGTDLDKVKDIEVIKCYDLPMGVSWQDYVETRNRPIQCYRCQRFHHRSNYCYMNPRCVACAEDHFSKDCDKPEDDTPKCINCSGEHRADDRDCPEWTQYKQRLYDTAEKNRERKVWHNSITKPLSRESSTQELQLVAEKKATASKFEFPMEKLAGWTGFLDSLKIKTSIKSQPQLTL